MKWKNVKDGTKFRLIVDLYNMSEVSHDLHYQLLTKEEVDDIITLSYRVGEEFEFSLDDEVLYGIGENDGEFCINMNGSVDIKLYEIVK